MRLYLIGMPGSGKTTIAKALAKRMNYPLYDLDAEIEKDAGMFISEMFETHGEKTFRDYETKMLEMLRPNEGVISCGGGIILNKENKKYMDGIRIYLDTKLSIIEDRIKDDDSRPLLRNNSLQDLYDQRFLKYQHFADVNINNNDSIEETVERIINHLERKNI